MRRSSAHCRPMVLVAGGRDEEDSLKYGSGTEDREGTHRIQSLNRWNPFFQYLLSTYHVPGSKVLIGKKAAHEFLTL